MTVPEKKLRHESVVVIMGATGTGKSKLSIDVALHFPSEVVNSDKIQFYRGLDITTNKMPPEDRRGVPHHLLGDHDPAAGELSPAKFCSLAGTAISGIVSRRRVPVVAGGSNSYLHALLADRKGGLRYRCCFLWVDVEEGVLREYLDRRVDEMVEMGMLGELEAYFGAEGVGVVERHAGLGKAIGVPEFRDYLMCGKGLHAYKKAIKESTRRLAVAQVGKIMRLREMGWALRRVDATETLRARLRGAGKKAEREAWERDVSGPSREAVRRFLEGGA